MIMECLWRHKNELTIDIYHYLPNDALYLKKNIISNSNVALEQNSALSAAATAICFWMISYHLFLYRKSGTLHLHILRM